MLLSFDAKQKLKLSVTRNKEYLSKYLLEEERVVGAMLDSKKLVPEGEGRYKYTVTSFKVFQLDIKENAKLAILAGLRFNSLLNNTNLVQFPGTSLIGQANSLSPSI